ncbi:hypothetical protein HOS55_gp065 [Pseudomonas phage PMBT3]|uniref:Uncharacterized protein n=1 Tax=Pseudomonas phage PMBT3 TaxID=2059856 RepID=A0A2I6PI40_9CAUD|nr:hypothetical protein HOS55_gp065 [Pseudomonas phage PMBT3]AUM59667.1 hypothetical protein [Pseudomonas phage PMBT3]
MAVSIQNLVLAQADTLEIQALDQCMTEFQKVSERKGGGSSVTFQTPVPLDNSSVLSRTGPRMEKMAFIVWLDRAQAAQLLDSKTPAGMNKDHEAPLRSLKLALQEVIASGAHEALLHGVDLNVPLDNLLELFGE